MGGWGEVEVDDGALLPVVVRGGGYVVEAVEAVGPLVARLALPLE